MRESGILFPIFSIPSQHGIGCFSKEAYEFVDFLQASGQGFWQILPMGPTGYGNSPYQPTSAFAGNPYFIALADLIEDGLLKREDVDGVFWGENPEKVDYGAMYENRKTILKKAYLVFKEKGDSIKKDEKEESFDDYKKEQKDWLEDYTLFAAIKAKQGGKSWLDWEDEGLKKRKAPDLEKAKVELSEEIDFIAFTQYLFDKQWKKLRAYAKEKKVKIIGDMPFYVSLDSADVWAHPEVFQMDKDLLPKVVAGCPPDAFSATGQLWGNPIYDWKKLKKADYDWWVKRIRRNYELVDVIRIDHFHGFCEYYAVPYGDETAEKGKMEKGPGFDLFKCLEEKVPEIAKGIKGMKEGGYSPIIAEDLGNNTPENVALLEQTGFPGMKVLQYGFTSWNSCYVNHRHEKNCVVYTGTHDNTTTMAWIGEISDGERDFTRRYINSRNSDYGQFVWDFIREAYRSVGDLCIIPLQDYLCKGKEARLNTPGTGDGNWQWRLLPNFLSADLERSIREMVETYSRVP